ncbi:MAG: type II toxin-antitoxin system VapC family toxin [Sulfuricellaceae bacterium]|nr:type II toxin-antitoxin system VapC family toxin [Sulfuricellaceae bacterium]
MNLLLDTHCLIWVLLDHVRLNAAAKRYIQEAETVWFSEASIWEIGLKWRKGKISLAPRLVFEQATRDRIKPLHLTVSSMMASCELKNIHSDPFDRLLLAQAQENDLRLLTADAMLAKYESAVLRF